jgi:hypothetical protein
MSYGKTRVLDKLKRNPFVVLGVAGSNPVFHPCVSYAEFDTYEYLPCGSAAVTLIKKAVVLLFLKGDDRENRRVQKK